MIEMGKSICCLPATAAGFVRRGYRVLVAATVLWGTVCMLCQSHIQFGGGRDDDDFTSCYRLEGVFNDAMNKWFGFDEQGLLILGLALPIFVTTLVGYVLSITCSSMSSRNDSDTTLSKNNNNGSASSKIQKLFAGDPAIHTWSFLVLVVPTTALCIDALWYRYQQGQVTSIVMAAMFLGSPTGTAAVVALGFFFVPVAKQSTLLAVLGLSPIHALAFHRWAGWVCSFYSIFHAACFVYLYIYEGHMSGSPWWESLRDRLIPPPDCWRWQGPFRFLDNSNPQCYGYWRNFTGSVGVLALIVLSLTSLYWFRRRYYRIFYWTHVVTGTLMVLGAIVHVPSVLLYTGPAIVYYLACTSPVLIQQLSMYATGDGVVRPVQTTFIGRSNGCAEIVFRQTPEAAEEERKQPSPYVRICVPEISLIWHPFSVSSISSDYGNEHNSNQWRLLFRKHDNFTRVLFERLQEERKQPPAVLVDAYYFGSDWMKDALRHDTVLIVAGGVGIVPFFSLIHRLYEHAVENNHHSTTTDDYCGAGGEREEGESSDNEETLWDSATIPMVTRRRRRRVMVHWYCREEGLMDHVMKNCFPFFFEGDDDQIESGRLGTADYNHQPAAARLQQREFFEFEFHCHVTSRRRRSQTEEASSEEAPPVAFDTIDHHHHHSDDTVYDDEKTTPLLSSMPPPWSSESSHNYSHNNNPSNNKNRASSKSVGDSFGNTASESSSNASLSSSSASSSSSSNELLPTTTTCDTTTIAQEQTNNEFPEEETTTESSIIVKYNNTNGGQQRCEEAHNNDNNRLDVTNWSMGGLRNTMVSFFVFLLVSGIGFVLQFWQYTKYTSVYHFNTMFRAYGIYAALAVSIIVPLLVEIVFRNVSWILRCCCSGRRTRHHHRSSSNGSEDNVVRVTTDNEEQRVADVLAGNTTTDESTTTLITFPYRSHKEDTLSVFIDVHDGRPPIEDVVRPATAADHPGIFLCGPTRLIDDAKRAAKKSRPIFSSPCAFYVEASDM